MVKAKESITSKYKKDPIGAIQKIWKLADMIAFSSTAKESSLAYKIQDLTSVVEEALQHISPKYFDKD